MLHRTRRGALGSLLALVILTACGVPTLPSSGGSIPPVATAGATIVTNASPAATSGAASNSLPTLLPTETEPATLVATEVPTNTAQSTTTETPTTAATATSSSLPSTTTAVATLAATIAATTEVTTTAAPTDVTTTSTPPQTTVTTAPIVATDAATATSSGSGSLEVFNWWTYDGEVDALQAVHTMYQTLYPGVNFIDTKIPGGAGINARAALNERAQQGQLPDIFQVQAGPGFTGGLAKSGQLEPLTSLFQQQGWQDIIPAQVLDQVKSGGEIYAVPIDIHRSNMLWYNKQVFAANNLQPPATLEDFYTAADALKANGITPLALGGKDKFEVAHLFESVLLATYGPDDYLKLFQPPYTLWTDPRMGEAIQTLHKMLQYANADRSTKTWADAAQDVLGGTAAMTIMGDWTEGYFQSKQGVADRDFGWVPAPGTSGSFIWLSDAFAMPKNAPDRDNALAWLKIAGSQEGQDAFNRKKGSIPARSGANRSMYDDYLPSSMDAFTSNKLVPSIVHGTATDDTFATAFDAALNVYSSDLDAIALTAALSDAVKQLPR